MPLTPSRWLRQAGAIPCRGGRVCLVNSRSGQRWVVPKGSIDPGQTAGEAALVESWEEAGLSGELSHEPVGSFTYDKFGTTCHVTLFVLLVTQVAEDWPEKGQRHRLWLEPAAAADKVSDPGLRDLILALESRAGVSST